MSTRYVATINTPGYSPMDDDPPTFDTPREAWAWLADERVRAEDDALDLTVGFGEQDEGYSTTVNTLESLGNGTLAFEEVGDGDGTGCVTGDTPGYGGDHDLGLAYCVSVVEPCDEGDHRVDVDGQECLRCGKDTPMPETFTINERVLTDDTVTWAPDGFGLTEQGYAAVVVWHTFQSPNSDATHSKGFGSVEAAEAFIKERYGKTSDELIYDSDDGPDESPFPPNTLATVVVGHVTKEAAALLSENGENPEYDRAIVELTAVVLGVSTDYRDEILAFLRAGGQ